MAQFDEDAPAAEDNNDETVIDPKLNPVAANREVVARRRRIEEVVESKRTKVYGGDYDFDLDN